MAEARFFKQHGLVCRTLDQETVILNPRNSYIHLLNGTGQEVWELLDAYSTVTAITGVMYQRYQHAIAWNSLHRDVSTLLSDLLAHRLVRTTDAQF